MSWSECIDHGKVSSKGGYSARHVSRRHPGLLVRLHQEACPRWEPGLAAHHVCFNKRCVNPAHLRAMTMGDHRRWHALDKHRNQDHEYEPQLQSPGSTKERCRECYLRYQRQAAGDRKDGRRRAYHREWRRRRKEAARGA